MKNYDPNLPSWSVMTKSRGGTVSVIRDLTLDQATKTYNHLDRNYGIHRTLLSVHKDFRGAKNDLGLCSVGTITWSHCPSDGDIEIRTVFGPPGWEFDYKDFESWPKYTYVYTDNDGNILDDGYQTDVDKANIERNYKKHKDEIENLKVQNKIKKAQAEVERLEAKDPIEHYKKSWISKLLFP